MRPLKEKISITIDSDLLEKLREKADEDGRVLAGISYRGLLFVINLLCVSGEKLCEDRSLG